jgi:hypothetical protein
MIEKLLALFLLGVFLSANIFISFIRTFQKGASLFLKGLLRSNIPENEKKSMEKVYTVAWLVIGLWAFWELKDKTLLGAFFGLLSFRSGANVGKVLVYSHHDAKLVEELGEGRVLGMISTVVRLSLVLEATFLLSLALAYKAVSVSLGRGTAGHLLLGLWFAGLIFGLIFGFLVARNNRGILLSDSISTIAFFTMRSVSIKTASASKKLGNNLEKHFMWKKRD